MADRELPLAGIRVVDLSRVLAGPYCGMLLGMLGAEVIKVEDKGGDESRTWPPVAKDLGSSYLGINLNKLGMVIDLKSPEGQQVVRDLVRTADVLVENFKAGTMEKFGLGYEALNRINPRLVYASISAFGRKGPKAEDPGYEALVQAYTGVMDSTGFPDGLPVRCGVSFLDMGTGITTTLAIVSSLLLRERTGHGGRVESSLLQTALGMMSPQVSNFFQHGVVPQRAGTAHNQLVPYQAYPTADSHIFIASGNQNLWERLCRALGLDWMIADPRFTDNFKRVENRQACLESVQTAIAKWKTDDLIAKLKSAGVPCTRVNSIKDLMADGQPQALGAIAELDDPEYGKLHVSGLPFFLNGVGGRVERRAPKIGEHTRRVLADLEYDAARIEALLKQGAVSGS